MTDSTHHTPRLLSDADAAADLAGVARPSLPSVSTALETALNRIEDMLSDDDGQAFKEARKFLPVGRAALAAQPGVVGEPLPDYSGMSREALERHAQRMAQTLGDDRAWKFYRKYADGPMMPPSCLCCGHLPEEVALRHMDLPGIVVCKKCRDAAAPTEAKPAQDAVDTELLDWLESQINEHGAIHLHDGNNPNGHGLGLRPGSLNRSLREAIRAAISAKKGG